MPEQSKPMNVDEALARVRGKQSILLKMLALFLKSGEFDAFEEALASGDYGRAADVAHAIKGMTGNLAMTQLFETSTQMMGQLRQGSLDAQLLESYRDALVGTRAQVEAILAEGEKA